MFEFRSVVDWASSCLVRWTSSRFFLDRSQMFILRLYSSDRQWRNRNPFIQCNESNIYACQHHQPIDWINLNLNRRRLFSQFPRGLANRNQKQVLNFFGEKFRSMCVRESNQVLLIFSPGFEKQIFKIAWDMKSNIAIVLVTH